MQDIAVAHSDSVGCTRVTKELNCTWFVRSHTIEYKRPAALGDTIVVTTWIDGTDLLRSTRKYTFESGDDKTVFATAETVWILVDVSSGRPRRIPADLIELFREESVD
ncbi:MAG: acyl-CoA thioesterase [Rhodothermales bacterium]|nr:acyl-CoA thioesterase [Rhodothermales bacterium]